MTDKRQLSDTLADVQNALEETCPHCGQSIPPPKYLWVQRGSGEFTGVWDPNTCAHFEIVNCGADTVEVWCTHGAWLGILNFDEDGYLTNIHIPEVENTHPVVGMKLTNQTHKQLADQ